MTFTTFRRIFLFLLIIILTPCIIINFVSTPNVQEETILQNSIAELQVKLEHLHSKYITSQEEIQLLTYQLIQMSEVSHLLPDVQNLVNNTNFNISNVKLPSVYNFLSHLLSDPNSLKPAFIHSKGRSGVSFVLGIPTVKRQVQTYLIATLRNLLDRMNSTETAEVLIVVFVAEVNNKI